MDSTPTQEPGSTPATQGNTNGSGDLETLGPGILTRHYPLVETSPSSSPNRLTRMHCFIHLLINHSLEMQENVCGALLSIMEENRIGSFQSSASRAKFLEAVRLDILSPGRSKLGPRILERYNIDARRCLAVLYRLACHVKNDLKKGLPPKAPDTSNFAMSGMFVGSEPPYLFNQSKRTLILNMTVRVFKATPNPPGRFMSYPLSHFLLDYQHNLIRGHEGPWVRRENVYLAPFLATARMRFPVSKALQEEFICTFADPTTFNAWQDYWMTSGEEEVDPVKWVIILEKLLQHQCGYIPQPPAVPTPMPAVNFIIRPKLPVQKTG